MIARVMLEKGPGYERSWKGVAMNTRDSITQAYDQAAEGYAAKFWNEFDQKPFDRMLLEWLAVQIPPGETVLEIGAGPGEVSGYLARLGVRCLATDRSERMVAAGKQYFPQVRFEVQDFLQLSYAGASFAGVAAFYAIVNLIPQEVRQVFAEVNRVLRAGGLFVFSFHIDEGEEKVEVENFFSPEGGQLTFYFFKVDAIKALIESAGFQIADILIRYPYPDVEYPSKRAYFVARKP